MKMHLLIIATVVSFSMNLFAGTITAKCSGSSGKNKYVLSIFAHSILEGGYQLVNSNSGPYPTAIVLIGTTKVTEDAGSILMVQLTEKATMLGDIPFFNSEAHQSLVKIDMTDRKNITALYNGVSLRCQ